MQPDFQEMCIRDSIPAPAPFILDRAIQAVYEKHGWNEKDINIGDKEYPTMSELYKQFEQELENTNYDGEMKGNIRSVLELSLIHISLQKAFETAVLEVQQNKMSCR